MNPIKATLKRIVQDAFEQLWSVVFRALGRLQRPSPETWRSSGDQRILIIAPHPDDEVAGCAGAILAHRRHGDTVQVSVATDGRRSRALGLAPAEMAATRRAEVDAAAAHLDVDLDWLGLPEGEWRIQDLKERLVEILKNFKPDTIYAPSRVDFHPEHEKVARALARALAALNDEATEIRIYASQVPLTSRLANLIVAVDLAAPRLVAAFRAHRSQFGSIERCLRHRRNTGRYYRLGGPVEELWCLTAAGYRHLHHEAPVRSIGQTFRGLRYYAWSDPLAYLRGRDERRRLARYVASVGT